MLPEPERSHLHSIPSPVHPLTRREREMLSLLADGLTATEIAGQLVLSRETVKSHVRNAMLKLGARTRTQAVALALQQDELSRP
jgi:DNA-binding CsgD family transcriptional regulator